MNIVVLTGYAKSGKDTVFKLLNEYRLCYYQRFAFADTLKEDLRDFLREKMKIDILTVSGEKKEIIRPLLVAYGCAQRNMTPDGLHWVKEVEKKIQRDFIFKIPVITDGRFVNEIEYFKARYNVFVVKVLRIMDDGPLAAPNEEEAKNQPLVDRLVDYTLEWNNVSDLSLLMPEIEKLHEAIQDKFYGKA